MDLEGYQLSCPRWLSNSSYAACVTAGECTVPARSDIWQLGDYYGEAEYMDHPVLNVNWDQASDYCLWAGKRLPTEAEWYMAAYGLEDNTTPYQGAYRECESWNMSIGEPLPVDCSNDCRSMFGACRMGGNASEWVSDYYGENYYYPNEELEVDPKGPETGYARLVLGASWPGANPYSITSSGRRPFNQTSYSMRIGFRCVRDVE